MRDKWRIFWVVKVGRQRCTFEHFGDALADWKSHDRALIYPRIMSNRAFESLKEFNGW